MVAKLLGTLGEVHVEEHGHSLNNPRPRMHPCNAVELRAVRADNKPGATKHLSLLAKRHALVRCCQHRADTRHLFDHTRDIGHVRKRAKAMARAPLQHNNAMWWTLPVNCSHVALLLLLLLLWLLLFVFL